MEKIAANQVYYLDVGLGDWVGRLTFRLIDWQAFQRDRIGLVNRFLSLWLVGTFKLIGWGAVRSTLRRLDGTSPAIQVANHIRIHRFWLSLYVLSETYTLDGDGKGVIVEASERFGPVPFLFRHHKRHTAEILEDGLLAVYDVPLLGTQWTGVYRVHPDRRHIDSTLTCAWAEAHERISKLAG